MLLHKAMTRPWMARCSKGPHRNKLHFYALRVCMLRTELPLHSTLFGQVVPEPVDKWQAVRGALDAPDLAQRNPDAIHASFHAVWVHFSSGNCLKPYLALPGGAGAGGQVAGGARRAGRARPGAQHAGRVLQGAAALRVHVPELRVPHARHAGAPVQAVSEGMSGLHLHKGIRVP